MWEAIAKKMYLVGYTAARIIACTTPIQTRLSSAVTLFSTKKKMNDINFDSKPTTSVSFSDDTYGEAEMRLTTEESESETI